MANYITDGKEMQHLNWKNLKRVYFLRTIYKHIVRVWQNHKDTQEPEVRAEVALQPRGKKAVTEPVEKKRLLGWGHLERSSDQHRTQPTCAALLGVMQRIYTLISLSSLLPISCQHFPLTKPN